MNDTTNNIALQYFYSELDKASLSTGGNLIEMKRVIDKVLEKLEPDMYKPLDNLSFIFVNGNKSIICGLKIEDYKVVLIESCPE